MSDDQNTTEEAATESEPVIETADAPTPAADMTTPTTAAADAPIVSADDLEGESESSRSARKTREGVVTSAAMDKTIVVTVTDRVRHPKYNKFVLRTKKLYTHDAGNDAGLGDRVRVMETRPLSKHKRWRLVDVLERAR